MLRVDPRVDLIFKKLFGVEENKELLISLINAVVSEEDQVKDVKILNPYNVQNFKGDKLSILDVKAEGLDGNRFNVEIQMTDTAEYDKRALYYWAKLYTEQLSVGEPYSNLNKAIGIHILNFYSVTDSDKYHNVFHITEKDTGIRHFKELELHTIELTKFSQGIDNNFDKLLAKMKQTIDIWTAFLAKYDLLSKRANELPEGHAYLQLKHALHVVEVMHLNEEERNSYEDHLKWMRDEEAALEKKYKTGLAEGMEKGIAEGMEKGIAEGMEKAMEQSAIGMLENNIDVDIIAKVTGLSIDAIKKLLLHLSDT
jgi:predicted transposase/invertase (TIGR01784 family)